MRNTVSRSFAVGIVAAVLLYGVGSLEVPIMVATIMPGIYFGFAYLQGSWVEVLQETVTCGVLISIYLYCLCLLRRPAMPSAASWERGPHQGLQETTEAASKTKQKNKVGLLQPWNGRGLFDWGWRITVPV